MSSCDALRDPSKKAADAITALNQLASNWLGLDDDTHKHTHQLSAADGLLNGDGLGAVHIQQVRLPLARTTRFLCINFFGEISNERKSILVQIRSTAQRNTS